MALPAFFVSKPDRSLRLYNNYRGLNKYLRRSPYYVPRIREILMRSSSARCLLTSDADHGYYARRLFRKSRPLTALCLTFGKYQCKRPPMGISTAPDEYQAYMDCIFGDLPFIMVYLDDLLVFFSTDEDHLAHFRTLFDRLQTYGVSLK